MAVTKYNKFETEEWKLGQRIRQFRKERGFTQDRLADIMDMDRAAISNYENGNKGEMGFTTLKKFATALGVTVSVLLGERQEEGGFSFLEELNEENRKIIINVGEGLLLKQQMTA